MLEASDEFRMSLMVDQGGIVTKFPLEEVTQFLPKFMKVVFSEVRPMDAFDRLMERYAYEAQRALEE
jgi:hypothetical protein